MQKNKFKFWLSAVAILTVFSLASGDYFAYAKKDNDERDISRREKIEREYSDDEIPEKKGDYKVKGEASMRVKVFVYKENARPIIANSLVCGLSDPDAVAPIGINAWRLPANWTYRLNLGSVPSSVGRTNLPVITFSSFAVWGSQGNINFTRGADTTVSKKSRDNKNIVAWGATSGTTLGVTYIWYNSVSKTVVEADTILNKQKPWSWTPYSAASPCADPYSYDAQNILTHEIGHWLGLKDEYGSSYRDSTMYGYGGKGEIKKDTLTTGDIASVKTIY